MNTEGVNAYSYTSDTCQKINTSFRKNENKYVYLTAKYINKRNILAVWARVCDGRQNTNVNRAREKELLFLKII